MTKAESTQVIAEAARDEYQGIAPDLISSLKAVRQKLTLAGAVDTVCDRLHDKAMQNTTFRAAWDILSYKEHISAVRVALRGYF